ncbi:MAG: nucleotide exchange factor GrpE [Actinomycetota bacterium]
MGPNEERERRRIRVTDRRVSRTQGEGVEGEPSSPSETAETPDSVMPSEPGEIESLREKNNQLLYQLSDQQEKLKRMTREHTRAIATANKDLIASLLPVLDNFDRAIAHAEDASGLEIVRNDLLRVLTDEGLEEISSEGRPFDYHVHDAMASHEDPDVTEETVAEVLLKGYRLKDDVIRHAKVVVARPVSDDDSNEQQAEG